MLIGVIADTHLSEGERLPPACIGRLRGCDLIVHAGDISCGAVLSGIEQIGPRVVAVSGNQDSHELAAKLPTVATIDLDGVRICVVHDAGPKRGRVGRLRRRFSDADAVVFGHSHIPLCDADGSFQIFNPGSPTVRRRALHHTMGLCLYESGRVNFSHVCLD